MNCANECRQRLGVAPGNRQRQKIFHQFMVEQSVAALFDQALAQSCAVSGMIGEGRAHRSKGVSRAETIGNAEGWAEGWAAVRIGHKS